MTKTKALAAPLPAPVRRRRRAYTMHEHRPTSGRINAPAPEQVRELRRSRNLSANEAARLVHTSPRAWMQWEAGERRMHVAFWELAQIKALALPVAVQAA